MCLVFFKLDIFPFSTRFMVLWFPCNMMLLSTLYPFPWIKYSVHNTGRIIYLYPMILLYVELRTFIFCFREPLVMAPAPRDIMPPVFPRKSLCVENYAFIHHFITERLSAFRVILTHNVPFIYFITFFSFPQSFSYVAFTLVVIKSTANCKSWRTRPLANKICATTWWNCEAFFSFGGILSFSYRTLNKLSVSGVESVVVISSGYFSNTFSCMAPFIPLHIPWLISQLSYPSSHEHIHALPWILVRSHQGILFLFW